MIFSQDSLLSTPPTVSQHRLRAACGLDESLGRKAAAGGSVSPLSPRACLFTEIDDTLLDATSARQPPGTPGFGALPCEGVVNAALPAGALAPAADRHWLASNSDDESFAWTLTAVRDRQRSTALNVGKGPTAVLTHPGRNSVSAPVEEEWISTDGSQGWAMGCSRFHAGRETSMASSEAKKLSVASMEGDGLSASRSSAASPPFAPPHPVGAVGRHGFQHLEFVDAFLRNSVTVSTPPLPTDTRKPPASLDTEVADTESDAEEPRLTPAVFVPQRNAQDHKLADVSHGPGQHPIPSRRGAASLLDAEDLSQPVDLQQLCGPEDNHRRGRCEDALSQLASGTTPMRLPHTKERSTATATTVTVGGVVADADLAKIALFASPAAKTPAPAACMGQRTQRKRKASVGTIAAQHSVRRESVSLGRPSSTREGGDRSPAGAYATPRRLKTTEGVFRSEDPPTRSLLVDAVPGYRIYSPETPLFTGLTQDDSDAPGAEGDTDAVLARLDADDYAQLLRVGLARGPPSSSTLPQGRSAESGGGHLPPRSESYSEREQLLTAATSTEGRGTSTFAQDFLAWSRAASSYFDEIDRLSLNIAAR